MHISHQIDPPPTLSSYISHLPSPRHPTEKEEEEEEEEREEKVSGALKNMGRAPCCDKAAVKKGPWSPEEDAKLRAFIEENGTGGNWIALPHKIGLKRCGKSCRLRWLNYLRPNIKHGDFSEEEDFLICSLYISIGSRWSIIAAQLPGRTDNDVKNYWNTKLKKKLLGKKRDHRQRHHEETDTGMTISKHERASSQQSMAASALERMQLHMKLQSLCHPFPTMDYSSVAAATPSPLLTTAATGVTAGAAGPSYHHKNLPQQIINPDTMRDDLMSASSATSRLGLGFHSSSSTVSSEGIRENSGLMFDGSINWEESLDSWGSGDEISSSSGDWDLSAVFQATDPYSMLQDWQHKK